MKRWRASASVLGSEHRDTVNSMAQLALILNNEGRYPEAEKLHREVMEVATRDSSETQDKLTRIAQQQLAIDLAYEGEIPGCGEDFREVLEVTRRTLGSDHPDTLGAMNNLAHALQQEHRYVGSRKIVSRRAGDQTPGVGAGASRHADVHGKPGAGATQTRSDIGEAEKLFRDTLEIKRRLLGPEHRSTLVTMGNLADVLRLEGQYAEAEKLVRQTLDTERRALGPEHSDTLVTLCSLGTLLRSEKRYSESEKVYRDALAGRRRALGDDHPHTAETSYYLACVLAMEGRRDEAFTNLQFAIDHQLKPEYRQEIAKNVDLQSLHSDPRFAALLAKSQQPAASAAAAKSN